MRQRVEELMNLLSVHRNIHHVVVLLRNLSSAYSLDSLNHDRVLVLDAVKNVGLLVQLLLRFSEHHFFQLFGPDVMLRFRRESR